MIRINDVYPCVQGEGSLAGIPMILIRTQGCGVGCPWCDTKETWKARESTDLTGAPRIFDVLRMVKPYWATLDEHGVAAYAREIGPALTWALVTGGEPAEQPLGPLVDALHLRGFKVAIETSGTALGHYGAAFDWVCVSPKIDMPGGRQILLEAMVAADEIKHVVGKQEDIEQLDRLLSQFARKPGCTICLQPVSQSAKATELCYRACLERGWRLSLQLHKYLDKP